MSAKSSHFYITLRCPKPKYNQSSEPKDKNSVHCVKNGDCNEITLDGKIIRFLPKGSQKTISVIKPTNSNIFGKCEPDFNFRRKNLMALRCHGFWNALVFSMSCCACGSSAPAKQRICKDAMVQTGPCSQVKAVWGIGAG